MKYLYVFGKRRQWRQPFTFLISFVDHHARSAYRTWHPFENDLMSPALAEEMTIIFSVSFLSRSKWELIHYDDIYRKSAHNQFYCFCPPPSQNGKEGVQNVRIRVVLRDRRGKSWPEPWLHGEEPCQPHPPDHRCWPWLWAMLLHQRQFRRAKLHLWRGSRRLPE